MIRDATTVGMVVAAPLSARVVNMLFVSVTGLCVCRIN